jgi:hypothetical protein
MLHVERTNKKRFPLSKKRETQLWPRMMTPGHITARIKLSSMQGIYDTGMSSTLFCLDYRAHQPQHTDIYVLD